MITTRPEFYYPVVKLSQFSTNPSTIHYNAVYEIFRIFLERAHTLVQSHCIGAQS
jgi:hypothetical protein